MRRTKSNFIGRVSAASLLFLMSQAASAGGPSGGTVASGSATISNPNANETLVNQTSNKALINWNSFSVPTGSSVIFDQPNSGSLTVNRVTGPDASVIDGLLQANGSIWILNGNGILFGQGSEINVGALLATTSDISDDDYKKGNYNFTKGASNASVVNQGTIDAANGGYVVLSAQSVANQGLIKANLGTVVLGGATNFTVDMTGDNLLRYQIATPPAGQGAASVSNAGTIMANGGMVMMTARAAANVQDNVINNTGMVEATSVSSQNGEIILDAGNGGTVNNSGTLNASGMGAGQTGGTVQVTGGTVNIQSGSTINASGDAGGGTVQIGGGPHGQGTLADAETTNVATGATITADAATSGNGGSVTVWSNGQTTFDGSVSAQGGAQSGNGGSVEASSGGTLSVGSSATVNTMAPKGATGDWLLDPNQITIATGGGDGIGCSNSSCNIDPSAITSNLTNTDVTLEATGEDAFIDINSAITYSSGNTLSLLSEGNITANASIQNSGTGNINLVAGWSGDTNLADLANSGFYGNNSGNVTIGGSGASGAVSVGSAGGATLIEGGDVTVDAVNGLAQIGYYGGTTNSIDVNGAININTTGDVAVTADSSCLGTSCNAMIGNGGVGTTGDVSGDVTIFAGVGNVGANVTVTEAAPSTAGFTIAAIGNISGDGTSSESGAIAVHDGAGGVTVNAEGSVGVAYIGNLPGASSTTGTASGNIEIIANTLLVESAATQGQGLEAVIGNGNFFDTVQNGAVTGDITIFANSITLDAQGGEGDGVSQARISNRGDGSVTGIYGITSTADDIDLEAFGDGTLAAIGNGEGTTATTSGSITIQSAGNVELEATDSGQARIGSGNAGSDNITVTAQDSVEMSVEDGDGSQENGQALIGNLGTGVGPSGGTIMVTATTGEVSLSSDETNSKVIIGNTGGTTTAGGAITVTATNGGEGSVSLEASGTGSVAWIGNDGSSGAASGDITVTTDSLSLTGSSSSVVQIGNGGQSMAAGASGDIALNVTDDLTLEAQSDSTAIVMIGNGGAAGAPTTGNVSGEIFIQVGGTTALDSGSGTVWIGNIAGSEGIESGDVTLITGNVTSTDSPGGGDTLGAMILADLGTTSSAGSGGNFILGITNPTADNTSADLGADNLDNYLNLGGPLGGSQGYSSPNELVLMTVGDLTVPYSIQNSGTGNITLVAGWDGTTLGVASITGSTTSDIVNGNNAYGNELDCGECNPVATVTIGGYLAPGNVAVGSAGGDTTVLGGGVDVIGFNGYAQIGYHGGGVSTPLGGNIDVYANDSNGGLDLNTDGYVAQIGNGSLSGDVTGAVAGNIFVYVAGYTDIDQNEEEEGGTVWLGNYSTGGSETGDVTLLTNSGDLVGNYFADDLAGNGTGVQSGTEGGNVFIGFTGLGDYTFGGVTYSSSNAFTIAAAGNLIVNASIVNNGSGDIVLVGGWDSATIAGWTGTFNGAQDTITNPNFGEPAGIIMTTPYTLDDEPALPYGNNGNYGGGTVSIGQSGTNCECSVGSAGGTTTVAGYNVTVDGGSNDDGPNSWAQIGYPGAGTGNIAVFATNNLTLTGDEGVAAQIGNGAIYGTEPGFSGNVSGNIYIQVAGTTYINGTGDGEEPPVWIGNVAGTDGIESGDVTLITGNVTDGNGDVTLDQDTLGDMIYNDLGYSSATGSGGNVFLGITNPGSNDTLDTYLQLGSPLAYSSSNSLTIASTGNLVVPYSVVNVGTSGDITLIGGWDGGTIAGWNGSVDTIANSDTPAGQIMTALSSVQGAVFVYGNNEGSVTVGNQSTSGGIVVVGSATGNTTVAGYNVVVTASPNDTDTYCPDGCYSQIGFESSSVNAYGILTGAGNLSGNVNVAATNEVQVTASTYNQCDDCYAQIGQGGFGANAEYYANISGNVSVVAGGAVSVTAGTGAGSYAQIGNGGENYGSSSIGGPVTIGGTVYVNSGDTVSVQGGYEYAQIGNGGFGSGAGQGGTTSGNVTVESLGDISLTGSSDEDGYAQIGNGGSQSTNILSGEVSVTTGTSLTLTGGSSQECDGPCSQPYAQIGNGSADGNIGVDVGGDTTIQVADNTDLDSSSGAPVWIGNVTGSDNNETGNVTLITASESEEGSTQSFGLITILTTDLGTTPGQGGNVTLGFTNNSGPENAAVLNGFGTYSSPNDFTVLASGSIIVTGSIQNTYTGSTDGASGNGALTILAGWDPTLGGSAATPLAAAQTIVSDITSDTALPTGAYGNTNDGVLVGGTSVSANTSVAVGSAQGPTTVDGGFVTVESDEGNAQIGFNGSGGGTITVDAGGPGGSGAINVTANATNLDAQIGNGGGGVTGTFGGDINVNASGTLTLAANATASSAQIGNGGPSSTGSASGTIVVQADTIVLDSVPPIVSGYVQIGNGGPFSNSGATSGFSDTGDVTVSADTITLESSGGGANGVNSVQIGNGGYCAGGNVSACGVSEPSASTVGSVSFGGTVTVNATTSLELTTSTNGNGIVQIGNGGAWSAAGLNVTPVPDSDDTGSVSTSGAVNVNVGTESVAGTLTLENDATGGVGLEGAIIGNGGYKADASTAAAGGVTIGGNVTADVMDGGTANAGSVSLNAFDDNATLSLVLIGNDGAQAVNAIVSGTTEVEVQGSLTLADHTSGTNYALVGDIAYQDALVGDVIVQAFQVSTTGTDTLVGFVGNSATFESSGTSEGGGIGTSDAPINVDINDLAATSDGANAYFNAPLQGLSIGVNNESIGVTNTGVNLDGGSLTLTANGSVAQTEPITVSTLDLTTTDRTTDDNGTVTLTNTSNAFSTLTLDSGNNATLVDSVALEVDGASVPGGDTLTLTAPSLTQGTSTDDAITASTLIASATGGAIDFNNTANSVGAATLSATGNATLVDASALTIDGATTGSGDTLTLTDSASGGIGEGAGSANAINTGSGGTLVVTTTGGGSVDLGNTSNVFGALTASVAGNATLVDSVALTVDGASVGAGDTLTLTAPTLGQGASGGDAISASNLDATATAGAIALTNASNAVGAATLSATGNATLVDAAALTVDGATTGSGDTLTLTDSAAGGIGQGTASGDAINTGAGGTLLVTTTAGGVSLTNTSNVFGILTLSSAGNATLYDTAALTIDGANVGNNTLTITDTSAGGITQGSSADDAIDPATLIITASGPVTLTNPSNEFSALTLSTTSNATLVDSSALTIDGATVGSGDTLNLTDSNSGGISQGTGSGNAINTGAGGTLIITTTGGGGVLLGNTSNVFGSLTLASAGGATLYDSAALTIDGATVGSGDTLNLTGSTVGEGSTSGDSVGASTFVVTATGGAITLTNASNAVGTLTLSATGGATLVDSQALTIDGASVGSGDTLTLTAPSLSQGSGASNAIDASTLIATATAGAIDFDDGSNAIGAATLSATGNATLADASALTIDGATTGSGDTLTLSDSASGGIGQGTGSANAINTGSGGTLDLTTTGGGSVNLTNSSNTFGNLTASVSGNATLVDSVALTVDGASVGSGDTLNLSAVSLGQGSGASSAISASNLVATATGGAVDLANSSNAIGGLTLSATASSTVVDATALTVDGANVGGANTLTLTALSMGQGSAAPDGITASALDVTATGGDINLNNSANSFATATISGTGNASLVDSAALTVESVSIGSGDTLSLTALSLAQTTGSAGAFNVATLDATTTGGDIVLTNSANAIGTATLSASGNATLDNSTALTIDGASVGSGDTLTLTATSLGQGTGAITASTLDATASNGNIDFANSGNAVGTATLSATGDASLTDATALTIASANVGGTLTLADVGTTSGSIGQTGVITAATLVASTTSTTDGDITLTNASNQIGAAALSTTGTGSATLYDGESLTITDPTVAGDLTLLTTGNLTVASSVQLSSGNLILVAGWDGKTTDTADLTNSGVYGNNDGSIVIGGAGASGNVAVGSASGMTTLAGDNVSLEATNGYAQVGYEGASTGGITVVASGNVSLAGGNATGEFAQIGNGGLGTSGNESGNVSVTAAGNVALDAGAGQEAYAQIGQGGAQSNSSSNGYSDTGSATVKALTVALTAGSGTGSYAQIGDGGYELGQSVNGTVTLGGAVTVDATTSVTLTGGGTGAYAQIGSGGDLVNTGAANGSGGTISGDITVDVSTPASGNAITATAGSGNQSYVQIGDGGNAENTPASGATVNFNVGGNISVSDLVLTGSDTGSDAYAQVGNGDASKQGTGDVSGNIGFTSGMDFTLTDGTADDSPALIGNSTGFGTVTGTITNFQSTVNTPQTQTAEVTSVQNQVTPTDVSDVIINAVNPPPGGSDQTDNNAPPPAGQSSTPMDQLADNGTGIDTSEGDEASDGLAQSLGQSLNPNVSKLTLVSKTLIPGVLTEVVVVGGARSPHGVPPADEDYSSWGNEALWRW